MTLRCLKCGASRRTNVIDPTRRPCPSCSGWLIPISGRRIFRVAQQLYKCGFNVLSAESYVYSFNPQDFGHKKYSSQLEAIWIQVRFGRTYNNDVFTELPETYREFQGGWQILYSSNEIQYKKQLGNIDGAHAEKVLIQQLYKWAVWLYESGMSSVLLLQGKL